MHLVLLTKPTAIAAIAAAATIIAAAAAAAAAVPAVVPAAAAADCAIDRLELDTYLMREALKPQLACNETVLLLTGWSWTRTRWSSKRRNQWQSEGISGNQRTVPAGHQNGIEGPRRRRRR